ncbi:alpha/beta hydrolase family protein [Hymenobacter cavernae]|uniref:Alpha/beta fold hydrolase n=1 Tax=Hymenobacter cavernae TaxID=2044852 RepID=A0ABQ1TWI6_9BACT|nr:alpha/beta fold hydrolase [Hymenobacter cavernae]GGF05307.1 hypothetical protein GCM10011383_15550 [Hymenobacter cavernae]
MIFNKSRFQLRSLAWFLGLTLLVAPAPSCKKDVTQPEPTATTPSAPQTGQLLSSTLIGEYSTSDLAGRIAEVPLAGALIKYPIKAYKLTYNTLNTDGKVITASGALLVPVVQQPLALLSYQHGTIQPSSSGDNGPSAYRQGSDIWSAVSVLASTGYIVSAPDYIGYGASKAYPHPYEHAASLASASLDMMRAARHFCEQQKVQLNQKNFLLGYSEGGFATLALHKLIEEKYANEFAVTACAPGAGAYHKSAFAEYILNSDKPLNFLSTYVWVLDTYNRVYGINRLLSYYFKAPYATQLQANMFSDVPDYPSQLFTDSFRSGVLQKTDAKMLAAFRDNDIYDWKPTAPLALFHGTADDYVPFFNSQDAYNAMQARGAKQVELRPIQGGNHFTSVATYTLAVYAFISQYNTELK